MPRFHPISPSFNAGELSPRLAARLDFVKYRAGLEECLNLIPLPEGGLMRRAGTRFVSEVKDSSVKGRLRGFQFNVEQAYMLELGDRAVRFYRHQGQITVPLTDAAITNGTFSADINGWTDQSTGVGSISHDAGTGSLKLDPGGTGLNDVAIAEQSVAHTATAVAHCISFRVLGIDTGIGFPGDRVELRIGSISGANDILSIEAGSTIPRAAVGYHCFEFTPPTSPFWIQFRRRGVDFVNRPVYVDDVNILSNQGFELTTPWPEASLFQIQGPQTADVLYLFHEDHWPHRLERYGHRSWSLVEVDWEDGPWSSQQATSLDGGKTTSAGNATGTTVVDSDKNEENDFWNGKYLFLADGSFAGEARRITDFVSSSGTFTVSPAFSGQVANNTAYEIWPEDGLTTMTPSADSGTAVTVTASDTAGINGDQGFLATDVGRSLRLDNGEEWGWGRIIARVSSTQVTVWVRKNFADTIATANWRLGAWSPTTGYPRVATFFEQRLYAAGTPTQPQTFWASQTADFENFKPDDDKGTVEDDDALDYTLSADEVNAIRWLSAGEDALAIGTEGGEWIPTAEGIVLTPLDITVRRQTKHGAAAVQPVRVGNVALFVQRAGRKIREFGVSPNSVPTIYAAPDMTRLAQHITRGGLIEIDYAEEPDSLLWAVRADGVLLSLTYRRDEDVVGWSRHVIGGTFAGGDAVVESVAVIPGDDGTGQVEDSSDRDEVWLIVKRTINGQTKRYVEVFEKDFELGDTQADAYYVDSCITYDGAAVTVIAGLDHLEGETVKIWGDGAIRPDKTVTGGQITLDTPASVAQIGLPYRHRFKSLKVADGNPAGTPLGKPKRIYGLTFDLLHSHTLRFGPDDPGLATKDFRLVSTPMDAGAPLFTGEQFVEFPGQWARDTRIIAESDDPAPFVLLAMAPEIDINPLR